MAKKTLEERFWEKVDIRSPDECWEWQAGLFSDGYGVFKVSPKTKKAHRVAWALTHGLIPKGLCVCHKCDNKRCVNPAHLFLGTLKDNARDRANKGRNADRRGEKSTSSKLVRAQVVQIRKLYAQGTITQRELAGRFGISRRQICDIINRVCWKHIRG